MIQSLDRVCHSDGSRLRNAELFLVSCDACYSRMERDRIRNRRSSVRGHITTRYIPHSSFVSVRGFAYSTSQRLKKRYRKQLEENGANTVLPTFHSAQCICDLGINDSQLCTWKSCGICNILKTGFEGFEFGLRNNSGR